MSNKSQRFSDLLHDAVDSRIFPGCSVVLIDGEEIFTKGFGHFTYDTDSRAVGGDTIYDVASLTKIVTVMSVAMMLIDDGVLNLHEKVATYLPEFVNQPEKELVLLSHLMTYTLDYNIPDGSKSVMGALTPVQVAANALRFPLRVPPATQYLYSNITAFILTQIIERVTGMKFDELVNERIFKPLHMNTATLSPAADILDLIPPTEITEDRGEVRGFVHDEFTHKTTSGGISNGAAGLFASIEDMRKFLQMTLNSGKGLFSEGIVEMWTRDYYPSLLPTLTPLGWGDTSNQLVRKYHRNIVVKSGFTGCFMVADLTNKKGFVLLSNRIYPKRPADASAFAGIKETLMEIALE